MTRRRRRHLGQHVPAQLVDTLEESALNVGQAAAACLFLRVPAPAAAVTTSAARRELVKPRGGDSASD